MTGAALAAEVTTAEPYVVPAVGEQAVHRRGARPRDQGDDADAAGRSRASRSTCCRRRTTFEQISELGVDGVFFSNGPGDPASAEHEITVLRQVLDARIPFFGICFGNQLLGRALGFGTYKLKYGHRGINQPVHRPHHRQGRGHRAQPRVRRRRPARRGGGGAQRRRARHVVRAGARLARLPERRRRRGAGVPGPAGVLRAVPPGGGRRPARRRLPVRPFRRADGPAPQPPTPPTPPTRKGAPDAPPLRHLQRPRHRLRADRHRAGLRVRLLRHPGLPGAARGGDPGHPGQLQPGDDHDRPRVRRRDLHRADHPRGDRDDHRQGAARRRPRDPGRPDRPQRRDRACTSRGSWRSTTAR